MKHSESKRDGCYCVKCALVVKRLLRRSQSTNKHRQKHWNQPRTWRKPQETFRSVSGIQGKFLGQFASISHSLFSHTHMNTDSTTSWEMPTWPRLEESRKTEGSVGNSHADTNPKWCVFTVTAMIQAQYQAILQYDTDLWSEYISTCRNWMAGVYAWSSFIACHFLFWFLKNFKYPAQASW